MYSEFIIVSFEQKKKRRGRAQDEEFVPGCKIGKGRRRKRALTSESSSEEFEMEEESESESLHFSASDSDPGVESEGSEYVPRGRNLKRALARKGRCQHATCNTGTICSCHTKVELIINMP